ncbi:MAG: zinc-ribbon domain-containing protein [Chloroflexi bacterium]|nr:zinc-ribbon domain-containing protein [Chloroflexota bacterium]
MTTQFCTHCGAKLAPKNRFCPVCGAEATQTTTKARQKRRPNKKSRPNPRGSKSLALWAVVGGVILLLIVGGLVLSNNNPSTPSISDIPDSHDVEGIPYPEVARISVSDAKALYDSGNAIIVDVRSQGEYDTAHVATALSLPLVDLEVRYRELPKDATIITYCT